MVAATWPGWPNCSSRLRRPSVSTRTGSAAATGAASAPNSTGVRWRQAGLDQRRQLLGRAVGQHRVLGVHQAQPGGAVADPQDLDGGQVVGDAAVDQPVRRDRCAHRRPEGPDRATGPASSARCPAPGRDRWRRRSAAGRPGPPGSRSRPGPAAAPGSAAGCRSRSASPPGRATGRSRPGRAERFRGSPTATRPPAAAARRSSSPTPSPVARRPESPAPGPPSACSRSHCAACGQ